MFDIIDYHSYNCIKIDMEEAFFSFTIILLSDVFLDPRQVLYKRCSKASGVCQRAAIPYYKGFTCKLHHEVPPYTSRLWKPTRLQKVRIFDSVYTEMFCSIVSELIY